MLVQLQVSLFLLIRIFGVKSSIYLFNINDDWKIEFYNCIRDAQSSLDYCRRPRQPSISSERMILISLAWDNGDELQREAFGKNCEYQLPTGETLEETSQWPLVIREKNPEKIQIYGDVVFYQTLKCDSGLLCLDWREICDGIPNCLEGKDEENCYLLEMNECHPDEEYRCVNVHVHPR